MHPEVVVFDARPRRIFPRWPLVAITDAILPVVPAHKISARPAVDRRIELFEQRECVATHAVDVVKRHQRRGPDPKPATATPRDLEPYGITRPVRVKRNSVFLERGRECLNRHHLSLGGPGSPDQTDVNRHRRVAGQNHIPDVAPTRDDGQPGLRNTATLDGRAQIHLRGMCANKRPSRRHRHRTGRTNGLPRRRHVLPITPRFADRRIKLAVLKHLRPDPAVDAAAEMFDELPVDQVRHHLPRGGGVDHDVGLQLTGLDQFKGQVVEPGSAGSRSGFARSRASARGAKCGGEDEAVLSSGVEGDGHPRPVRRSRDSLRR